MGKPEKFHSVGLGLGFEGGVELAKKMVNKEIISTPSLLLYLHHSLSLSLSFFSLFLPQSSLTLARFSNNPSSSSSALRSYRFVFPLISSPSSSILLSLMGFCAGRFLRVVALSSPGNGIVISVLCIGFLFIFGFCVWVL